MKFEILHKELWAIANAIIKYFKKRKVNKFLIEKPLSDNYKFRPTISFKNGGSTVVVEVKDRPLFQEYFEDFVKDCLVNRESLKIYMAFPHILGDAEISFSHSFLIKVKKYGIGILLVKDNSVIVDKEAVKCYMRIAWSELNSVPKHRVYEIIDKFNEGRCIDAIRDITEAVEDEVDKLAIRAKKKKKIRPTLSHIEGLNFESKINLLSAPEWKGRKQKRYFDEDLKNDLKSYKGTRNLSHHPRNKQEERKLEQQLLERMRMGIRLWQDVCKIQV